MEGWGDTATKHRASPSIEIEVTMLETDTKADRRTSHRANPKSTVHEAA